MSAAEEKPRRIKVLHLLASLGVGGTERGSVDLIRALDPAKVESTVCLYRHRAGFVDELTAAGFPVVFLEKEFLSKRLRRLPRLFSYPAVGLESLIFVWRLSRFIARQKPDIIHARLFSANLWGRLAGRLAGVPGIITTENSRYARLTFKNTVLGRLLAPLSDRVVAISEEVGRAALEQQRIPPAKLVVVPNGIRLERIAEAAALPADLPDAARTGGPTIACLGRLSPEKRQDVLLRAVSLCRERFPGIRCWLIGAGREEARLRQLAGELGLADRIVFLGQQFNVARFFPHIQLMANSSEREGLPISIIEAMAGGVPVVATDVGGTGEIVHDGETGLLVPPNDPRALAEGICRLLADRELARRLAANGKAFVERRHSLSAVARIYERLYAEILSEKQAARSSR